MAGPPVAIVRSHTLINSRASGMLGRSTHCSRSSGAPSGAEGGAHDAHDLVRRLPAGGMRREDHRVPALQRVDGDADRRHVRTGDGDQRGDDAGRLRVLDEPLLGNLLDDADALLPQRVAQDPEDLRAPARLGAPHAALGDAHLGESRRRALVASRPGDGTAQAVHRGLVVVLDVPHRGTRALEQVARERLFFGGNRSRGVGGDSHDGLGFGLWPFEPEDGRCYGNRTVTARRPRGPVIPCAHALDTTRSVGHRRGGRGGERHGAICATRAGRRPEVGTRRGGTTAVP